MSVRPLIPTASSAEILGTKQGATAAGDRIGHVTRGGRVPGNGGDLRVCAGQPAGGAVDAGSDPSTTVTLWMGLERAARANTDYILFAGRRFRAPLGADEVLSAGCGTVHDGGSVSGFRRGGNPGSWNRYAYVEGDR
jgi:hypothetical protein